MNRSYPDWDGFNGNYALPEDEVDVWRTGPGLAPPGLEKILSPDERERADRFHFDADRRRSVIGRGCLRLLLGKILHLPCGLNMTSSENQD
jgi:4'-phosphopantetheinyl transferase